MKGGDAYGCVPMTVGRSKSLGPSGPDSGEGSRVQKTEIKRDINPRPSKFKKNGGNYDVSQIDLSQKRSDFAGKPEGFLYEKLHLRKADAHKPGKACGDPRKQ